MRLEGARCLVVGGARRLGRVLALDLAAHGADVVVSTRSAVAEAEATSAAIRALGRRSATVIGDAAAPPGTAAFVADAATALGGLDVMVYTPSGPFRPAAPQDIGEASRRASFEVIVHGFFAVACASHEQFTATSPARGVIVAITDLLATRPYAAFAAHCAAKAAQVMLVRTLAKAWADEGTRVCGVAPGPVDLADDARREATLRAARKTPLGRAVAPEEIAAAVRFVVEDDALTGVNLQVDGGALLV